MSRNARTCQIVTPNGVMYFTPAEMRRLVSAAMQQLKATQESRGLTETEKEIVNRVNGARHGPTPIGI